MIQETIFDKMLKGEIPYDEVYQDKHCLAFKDIEPQAPVHILIIPKKKLTSLRDVQIEDQSLLGHLLVISQKIAKQEGLEDWRTIINTGAGAGQTVFYLHIHLLGGRALRWPPG